jgi:hypothetical protein
MIQSRTCRKQNSGVVFECVLGWSLRSRGAS